MLTADVQLWKELGARCVRVTNVAIDREPVRRSGSSHSMVLSAISFFCIHPRIPSRGIMLGLSQRCDEGQEDAALGENAASLAKTLEFHGSP